MAIVARAIGRTAKFPVGKTPSRAMFSLGETPSNMSTRCGGPARAVAEVFGPRYWSRRALSFTGDRRDFAACRTDFAILQNRGGGELGAGLTEHPLVDDRVALKHRPGLVAGHLHRRRLR